MPDKAYDLAIVDPPYGIGEDGGTNKTRGKLAKAKDYKPFVGGDKTPPSCEYFEELFRVSASQIIWGANHFASRIPNPSSPSWIVWDKRNGSNDFADCELAYASFSTSVRMFSYRWSGMLQENMKQKESRIHPTQKPVALYKWLLTNYAKEGNKILDTHLGSGSIAIACHDKGFSLDAWEIDEDYFQAAKKRFDTHARQLSLL